MTQLVLALLDEIAVSLLKEQFTQNGKIPLSCRFMSVLCYLECRCF